MLRRHRRRRRLRGARAARERKQRKSDAFPKQKLIGARSADRQPCGMGLKLSVELKTIASTFSLDPLPDTRALF